MGLSVGEEATAQTTVTDGNHHKVLHTVRTAIGSLTQCRDMGIIGHCHSQSKTVAQHRCQRDDTLPRQVGCVLDTARDITGAGSTDTNGADTLITAILFQQREDILT